MKTDLHIGVSCDWVSVLGVCVCPTRGNVRYAVREAESVKHENEVCELYEHDDDYVSVNIQMCMEGVSVQERTAWGCVR